MITPNKDYSLGKAAFVLFTLEELRWVLVLVAVSLLVSIFRDATQAPFLISASRMLGLLSWAGVIFGLGWSYMKFRATSFSFEEYDLTMRSGIIEKRETAIPYRNIQSVDIVRGLVHQALGLSRVVMLTAGHEEAGEKGLTEVVLEPIGKTFAEDIRNALQERIGVQVVRPERTAELDGQIGK